MGYLFNVKGQKIVKFIECGVSVPHVVPHYSIWNFTKFLAVTKQLYEWFSPSVHPSLHG